MQNSFFFCKTPTVSFQVSVFISGHANASSEMAVKTGVKSILVHPHFNYQEENRKNFTFDHDIALLRLSKDLQFSNKIQPIALPSENHTDSQLRMVKLVNDSCFFTSTFLIVKEGNETDENVSNLVEIVPLSFLH